MLKNALMREGYWQYENEFQKELWRLEGQLCKIRVAFDENGKATARARFRFRFFYVDVGMDPVTSVKEMEIFFENFWMYMGASYY